MKEKPGKMARFDEIYKNNIKRVYTTAINYSDHNEELAIKVVQNTFLKLYIHLDYMTPKSIRNWLIVNTQIYAIDGYKKNPNKAQDEWLKKNPTGIFLKLYDENPLWYEIIMLVVCLMVPIKNVAKEMQVGMREVKKLLYAAEEWIDENYHNEIEKNARLRKLQEKS